MKNRYVFWLLIVMAIWMGVLSITILMGYYSELLQDITDKHLLAYYVFAVGLFVGFVAWLYRPSK